MTTSLGHYPSNPDMFAFDADLAPRFDDMAQRSIPGYTHAHEEITRLIRLMDVPVFNSQVWDFGCSTGAGLQSIYRARPHTPASYYGCDVSRPMREMTRERCPWAHVEGHDLLQGLPERLEMGKVSVAVYAWTLQFILDEEARRNLIKETYKALRPGGMMFVFEKWTPECLLENARDGYIAWRVAQGYTQEEIEAKTKALRNVMRTWSESDLIDAFVSARVDNFAQVYKSWNFGGYVVHKQK